VLVQSVTVEQEPCRVLSGNRRHDTLSQNAWQLALNYVLIGEDASYIGRNLADEKTAFSRMQLVF